MTQPFKRKPWFTIAGVVLPLLGIAAGVILAELTPGLGAIAVLAILMLVGAVLGGLSMVVALWRGEPWPAVQALVLVVMVGVALQFYPHRTRVVEPAPYPVSEVSYVALAPLPERRGPTWVSLAYPAPDSSAAHDGWVIGVRDARGIITSLRAADPSTPLRAGEMRTQLNPVDGRWTLGFDWEHIRGITPARLEKGAYLEYRPYSVGSVSGLIGVADAQLRHLSEGEPRASGVSP